MTDFAGWMREKRPSEAGRRTSVRWRKLWLTSLAFMALLGAGSCTKSIPTLNLLVSEGYADPSFVREFEGKCECKVNAAYVSTSDELMAKLRGAPASSYDVISVSSDVAASLVGTGLATPLDLGKLSNYGELSPVLTSLPLVKKAGGVYGVPLVWGSNPLLYDTTFFPEPPESWAELWDPKLEGKVSVWDDLSTVYVAAQVLGFDRQGKGAIYNLSDEQLEQVKAKLVALKPNVRKLWASDEELTGLFKGHEIVAAMGWPLVTNELKKANFPIGETIPREGTTGWVDYLMIPAASGNKELAHSFLNYMLAAQTQKQLSEVTGFAPANPRVAALMTKEQSRGLHLDEGDAYQRRIAFWQDVPRRAKYTEVWSSVKAGN